MQLQKGSRVAGNYLGIAPFVGVVADITRGDAIVTLPAPIQVGRTRRTELRLPVEPERWQRLVGEYMVVFA